MSRNRTALLLLVPLVVFATYVVARATLPSEIQKFIFAENGVVELGTAVLFLVACVVAFRLTVQARDQIPNYARAAFGLFALASLFVALEEISYGQQLFGWASPEWFEANNHHGQTNLHNLMGNRPSHLLKNAASHGSLVGFVIVPLVAMAWKHTYRRGHWTFYLLPRAELIAVVAVAQLCSLLWDLPKSVTGNYWHQGWNEVRELFWGVAAVSYLLVMRRRFLDEAGATMDRGRGESGTAVARAA